MDLGDKQFSLPKDFEQAAFGASALLRDCRHVGVMRSMCWKQHNQNAL
jgi:hypothetical protein